MSRKKIQNRPDSTKSLIEIDCERDAPQVESALGKAKVDVEIASPGHGWIYHAGWNKDSGVAQRIRSEKPQPKAAGIVPLKKVPDDLIHARIIFDLFVHPQIDDTHIHLRVEQGLVTLSGSVPGYRQQLCAEYIAAHETGVTLIRNQLEVIDKAARTHLINLIVAENVTAILDNDDRIRVRNLKVTVKQGVAELKGIVPTRNARLNAQILATKIPGISKVENRLAVRTP